MSIVVASVAYWKVAIRIVVIISISITYGFGVRFSLFTSIIDSIWVSVVITSISRWPVSISVVIIESLGISFRYSFRVSVSLFASIQSIRMCVIVPCVAYW